MSSRAQLRRHTPSPPATSHAQESASRAYSAVAEGDIRLDDLGAEFVSEETLPPRPPRRNHDDTALDAFGPEASSPADPSLPNGTSTAVASAAPNARRDRRIFFLPARRVIVASAGLMAVVTVLGLLVKQTANPVRPPAATRSATVASTPESRPTALPPTAASPDARPAAPPVETPPDPGRPVQQGAPEVERTGSGGVNAPMMGATGTAFTPSPGVTAGDTVASGPDLMLEAGVRPTVPLLRPLAEIPAASLPALVKGDDSQRRRSANLAIADGRSDDSPPPAGPKPALPSAHDLVSAILGQYQTAYSRLDAETVQAIWPSVDRPRLERAFRNLDWQDLEFTECQLEIVSATAVATCRGVLEYATRVGNRSARDARRWTITLQKASESWLIQNVLMR